ncbi:putative serine-threonine rich protein [Zalerion maritima]|uniref:Serine-threonine rich protein n=1 Tax=Zalerion maritima TaxID=339359 RepID=A0AAD5WWG0_9PEZI|nr:putative serine-threonine rich protein [Zalerion maritima]
MKFSTSLLSTLAPVALAKSVHNHYPQRRSAGDLAARNGMAGVGITTNALTEVVVIWVNPGAGAETTTINEQVTVTETVTAGVGGGQTGVAGVSTTIVEGATGTVAGTGATHSVTLGGPGGLAYTPDSVIAAVGDVVVFTFLAQNHSATQSAFDTPCDPLVGGMDTGFQANPDNTIDPAPQVAMQVMVETPLWFYCAQMGHCGKGMTFSINPTADKTQAMFQAMAIQQRGAGDPSAITGGEAPPGAANPADNSTVVDPALTSLSSLPGAESTAIATATGTADVVQGTGTVLPDGSCACAVVVGSGSFPAVGAQGIGNFGGMAGTLPASMVEAI